MGLLPTNRATHLVLMKSLFQVDIGSYAAANGSSGAAAALEDSSEDEDEAKPVVAKRREDLEGSHDDKAKPVVAKPQDDLDDFLNMGAADKMDDYQAL